MISRIDSQSRVLRALTETLNFIPLSLMFLQVKYLGMELFACKKINIVCISQCMRISLCFMYLGDHVL